MIQMKKMGLNLKTICMYSTEFVKCKTEKTQLSNVCLLPLIQMIMHFGWYYCCPFTDTEKDYEELTHFS